MVSQVDNGIFIAFACILYFQLIILRKRIGHLHLFIARKSHTSILILKAKNNAILHFAYGPNPFMISLLHMTVQIIAAVIYLQLILLSVQFKTCVPYTICIGPDYRSKETSIFKIRLQSVKSQNHISSISLFIRYKQVYQNSAIINNACTHACGILQPIPVNLLTGFCCSKQFFFCYHPLTSCIQ